MGLDIRVELGTTDNAAEMVKANPHIGVFISRGGTATVLASESGKPVISITASFNDLVAPIHNHGSRSGDSPA